MKDFETSLAAVAGSIRSVDKLSVFERRRFVSTYLWNNASDLHAAAHVLWAALRDDFPLTPVDLGLSEGFSFNAALPPVVAMNAGLSLELLLKAILKILGRPEKHTHKLNDLLHMTGITVSADHAAILDLLTEQIIWAGRYPTPKTEAQWEHARKVSQALRREQELGPLKVYEYNPDRAVNARNYEAIWSHLSACYWRAKGVVFED